MASTSQISSSNILATATRTHTFVNFKALRSHQWSQPNFSPLNYPDYYFWLGVNPKPPPFENVLQICLQLNEKLEKFNIEYEISILNLKKEKCFTKYYIWNFDKNREYYINLHSFISYNYLVNEANGLIPNNSLTLFCEVKILKENISTANVHDLIVPESKILQNYQTLLESGKFSDVVLVLGKSEIKAHKNILAAQSSVFTAMFDQSETKEAKEGRVEIIDMTVDVCMELLRYIYAGKIPGNEFALDLFVAADKYELEDLKQICEKMLASSLYNESVVKTFLLADMHSSTELKSKCIDYITENSIEVMKTDDWKQLLKTRIELVVDLFQNLSIKYNSK